MVTQETLQFARTAANDLRQRGDHEHVAAIDALVAEGRSRVLMVTDALRSK
jgi:hypothetical protein